MAAERRQIETCWDSQRGTAGSMESQKNVSGKGREEARGREGKAGQRARMSLSKLHRLFVGFFFSVLSSFFMRGRSSGRPDGAQKMPDLNTSPVVAQISGSGK